MYFSRAQLNDICFPIEYCIIFFPKSKSVNTQFSFPKGVFFVQFGPKKLFSLVSVFLLAWLTLRFLLPLFSPFLFGAALALAAEPAVSLLSRRLRLPRGVSAGIGVSMTFFLLAMLLLLLCAFLVRQLRSLAAVLPDVELTLGNGLRALQTWLLTLSTHAPGSVRPLLQDNVRSLFSDGAGYLDRVVRYLLGLAGNLLSHIPDSALTLGTAILSGYMISAKLPRLKKWLMSRISPQRLGSIRSGLKRLRLTVTGWLMAQLALMAVTFAVLLPGFLLLRISHPLPWALGVSLVDAFPVLGTGTVLIPWAVIQLLQGNTAQGIALAGLYATVSLIRSALEPKLLGRQLGLDPLVMLVVLYAGFRLWGIGGMLLAPVLTVTAMQILPERKKRELP